MPSETLRVVARIKARAEKVEELREALLSLVAPTREEAGCLSYELLQNTEDPTDFTFVEEWTGNEALAAHFETEHLKALFPRVPELCAAEPDIRTYTVLA
jgi:quinol monooxygenase YgiN